MASASYTDIHIKAACAEVITYHLGTGPLPPGGLYRPIATPAQRGGAAALNAAELATWDASPEAEFLALFNAVLAGHAASASGRVFPAAVPNPHSRASTQFRDCPPLQTACSRALTLTAKLVELRSLNRTAQEAAKETRSRTKRAVVKRVKRAKGVASRASGAYGLSAAGVPKRSPHINLGKRSPPPGAAVGGAAVSAYVRRSVIPGAVNFGRSEARKRK
jgi:hypothetical protein